MPWPVSIKEFNYWDYLAVNPELSHRYQLKKLFLETSTPLQDRGLKIKLPDDLKGKLYYDSKNECLVFYGQMSEKERDILLSLCKKESWQNAIKELYQKKPKPHIPPHLDISPKKECKELEEWAGKEFDTGFKNSKRGKRTPNSLVGIIERDQRIFREINNLRLKNLETTLKGSDGTISRVARKYHLSQKGGEEIYWKYTRRAYTRVGKGRCYPPITDLKRPRSYRQARARALKRLNAKLMTPGDLTRKEWNDFYTWLATCLKNLKSFLAKP